MRRTLIAIVMGFVGLTSMAAISQTAQAGTFRPGVATVEYHHHHHHHWHHRWCR